MDERQGRRYRSDDQYQQQNNAVRQPTPQQPARASSRRAGAAQNSAAAYESRVRTQQDQATPRSSSGFVNQPVTPKAFKPIANAFESQNNQPRQNNAQSANQQINRPAAAAAMAQQGSNNPMNNAQMNMRPMTNGQQSSSAQGGAQSKPYASGATPVQAAAYAGYQAANHGAAPQQNQWQQGYNQPGFNPAQRGYTPAPAPVPQNNGKPGKTPKPRKGNPVVKIAIGVVAAILVIVAVSVAGVKAAETAKQTNEIKTYVESFNSVFCNGVYVDGIHLGGMTAEEGVAAVTAQAQQRNSSWNVQLTYQGQTVTTITADQLGMKTDVLDVMSEAWDQGHIGDMYQRKQAMADLMENHWNGYTAIPSGDTSVIDSILERIRVSIYQAPVDATFGSFNPDESYPFTFNEEVYGRVLDVAPLKTKLYQMVSAMESGNVEIEPSTVAPSVTVADLKVNYEMRSSVYTPISSKSTENRTNNIRRCFESINGYVLNPGQKFSFNNVVGKRTTANGFYEAIEYAYGTEVMGIGGGTCQASTTLYQAAVVAGLTINHREPHSDAVSYAAYGEDATVSWEGTHKIDLTFTNSTSHPIYIVAAVQTDPTNKKRYIARVTMYGESLGNVRYELTSQTDSVIPAPTEPKYVKDKNQTYVTYTDQEKQVSKAKEGYKVSSYRVKYVDNVEVERVKLYTDTYEAKAATIYVGTKKRE